MRSILHYSNISHFLNDTLKERCLRNSNYSLRAFARDLKIQSGALSQIINNKRELSFTMAIKIAYHLKLNENERYFLMDLLTIELIQDDSILEQTKKNLLKKCKKEYIISSVEYDYIPDHKNSKEYMSLNFWLKSGSYPYPPYLPNFIQVSKSTNLSILSY